eukprot:250721-Chlamydomonas_euryale.AAC.2
MLPLSPPPLLAGKETLWSGLGKAFPGDLPLLPLLPSHPKKIKQNGSNGPAALLTKSTCSLLVYLHPHSSSSPSPSSLTESASSAASEHVSNM